ncbi:craniofacial development protein 2-like [Palaemon carinicauda]|uniref:craniofacial development protein 2-like n=1 Tax=Palaemon carinicauda TaxID=392227 RepID=UPI0035B6A457
MEREDNRIAQSPGRSRVLRISRFINSKEKLKIGNWNVKTMNQIGKLQQVENEFMKYILDRGLVRKSWNKAKFIFIQEEQMELEKEGVRMMITSGAGKALTEWKAVNSILLHVKFKSKQCNMNIIIYYAPTYYSPKERKDEYS